MWEAWFDFDLTQLKLLQALGSESMTKKAFLSLYLFLFFYLSNK